MLTVKYKTEEQRFEQTLATHCAPSMAGIKAADMISWAGSPEDTRAMLDSFGRNMAATGIRFRQLCFCRGRSLILVYRTRCLLEQLEREEVRELLRQDGYPVDGDLEGMLDYLGERILACPADFPHEVGLFLGYPVEDVVGYRQNTGRDFKVCGLWKVYSDVERAQACFHRYKCCRNALCRRVEGGCPLCRVFRAA